MISHSSGEMVSPASVEHLFRQELYDLEVLIFRGLYDVCHSHTSPVIVEHDL